MRKDCEKCQEIASISGKKKIKMHYRIYMMDFGGIYLNNDILEISMYDSLDPLMTILLNQYMNHDCTCKMQIKTKAL